MYCCLKSCLYKVWLVKINFVYSTAIPYAIQTIAKLFDRNEPKLVKTFLNFLDIYFEMQTM